MGQLRDLARRVAGRVARVVAKDDLFEKPGERPSAAPLPGKPAETAPVARPPSDTKAAASKASAPSKAPAASERAGEAPLGHKVPASSPAAAASVVVHVEPSAVKAARPKEGCVPVDVAGLRAAITPAGKPLVVNHWATWCDPCVDELPRLVRAAAGVADLGEFVGVSWDLFDHPGKPATVAKKVAQFADNAGVGYASVLFTGKPEELFAACGLDFEQIPQTLVIAPDGRVVYHKKGVLDHDDVFPLINAVKGALG